MDELDRSESIRTAPDASGGADRAAVRVVVRPNRRARGGFLVSARDGADRDAGGGRLRQREPPAQERLAGDRG